MGFGLSILDMEISILVAMRSETSWETENFESLEENLREVSLEAMRR